MKRRAFFTRAASAISSLYAAQPFIPHGSISHSFLPTMFMPEPIADPAVAPPQQQTPPQQQHRPRPAEWSNTDITLAWIGHSTVLINFYGLTILTDPILFDRVGFYFLGTTLGMSRLVPPAIPFQHLPKPDVVLLSHAHMDHCDYESLKRLTEKFPSEIRCIMAKNTKDVVEDLAWNSVQEIDWNETTTLNFGEKMLHLQALEVKHFGWRLPGDPDRAARAYKGRSFNAYLMEHNGKRVVFGGDTAFTDKFRRITGGVDIAIMPIGAYNPWRTVHCNPEEALQMAQDMQAGYFVPIHCNTFPLGREPRHEPLERLHEHAPKFSPRVAVSAIGQTFVLPQL